MKDPKKHHCKKWRGYKIQKRESLELMGML